MGSRGLRFRVSDLGFGLRFRSGFVAFSALGVDSLRVEG